MLEKNLYFIAEIGLNHNGDIHLAKEMIDAAKASHSDAVKFQSIKAEKLVSAVSLEESIPDHGISGVKTVRDFWEIVSINRAFHVEVSAHCRNAGIEFLSTPFDVESADLLDSLGVPKFKIASGDLTNFPLIEHVAKKHKMIILSTGASTLEEIQNTVAWIRANGTEDVVLLHCVSLYPTPSALVNLSAIPELATRFHLPVGLSDHTTGIHIALAAIAKGARVIEKHFTIDRTLPGPDQIISLEPREFDQMVQYGREIATALLPLGKQISPEEERMRPLIRRSIVAARRLRKGTILEIQDLDFKRPGTGISPVEYRNLLGKRTNRDFLPDEPFDWAGLSD